MEAKNEVSMEKSCYDRFYAKGGWNYKPNQQWHFIQKRMIEPMNLTPCKLLDIGCGMGLQTSLFSRLGFNAVGVEVSDSGIEYARENYPETKFIHGNVADINFPKDHDIIFARGMSWYHYELNEVNVKNIDVPKETERLFTFLKHGGLFILVISTDFTGGLRNDGKDRTINNKLSEYQKLFSRYGKIVFCTDYRSKPLNTEEDTKGAVSIIIATRKL